MSACNAAFDALLPILAKKVPFMQWVKTENSGIFVHTSEGKLALWGPLTPEHPVGANPVKKMGG